MLPSSRSCHVPRRGDCCVVAFLHVQCMRLAVLTSLALLMPLHHLTLGWPVRRWTSSRLVSSCTSCL